MQSSGQWTLRKIAGGAGERTQSGATGCSKRFPAPLPDSCSASIRWRVRCAAVVAAFAPGYVFASFSVMMMLQPVWVKTMVVETKGMPLELVQQRLDRTWYSGGSGR